MSDYLSEDGDGLSGPIELPNEYDFLSYLCFFCFCVLGESDVISVWTFLVYACVR